MLENVKARHKTTGAHDVIMSLARSGFEFYGRFSRDVFVSSLSCGARGRLCQQVLDMRSREATQALLRESMTNSKVNQPM